MLPDSADDLLADPKLKRIFSASLGELERAYDEDRAAGALDPELEKVYDAMLEARALEEVDAFSQLEPADIVKQVDAAVSSGRFSKQFADQVLAPMWGEKERLRRERSVGEVAGGIADSLRDAGDGSLVRGVGRAGVDVVKTLARGVYETGKGGVQSVVGTAQSLLTDDIDKRLAASERALKGQFKMASSSEAAVRQTVGMLGRLSQAIVPGNSKFEQDVARIFNKASGGMVPRSAEVGAKLESGDVMSAWELALQDASGAQANLRGEGSLARLLGVNAEELETFGFEVTADDLKAVEDSSEAISELVEGLFTGGASLAFTPVKGSIKAGLRVTKTGQRLATLSEKIMSPVARAAGKVEAGQLARKAETTAQEAERLAKEASRYNGAVKRARVAAGAASVKLGEYLAEAAATRGVGTGAGVLSYAVAAAGGADSSEALYAGVAATIGSKALTSQFTRRATGNLLQQGGRALQRDVPLPLPLENFRRGLIDFRADYKPFRAAVVGSGVGAAASLPFVLGAETDAEAASSLVSGAGFGAAAAGGQRVMAWGSDQLTKAGAARSGAQAEMQGPMRPSRPSGVDAEADGINLRAEQELSQAGLRFVQQQREFVKKAANADYFVGQTPDDMAALYRRFHKNPGEAADFNGVFIDAKDSVTGRPVVLSKIGTTASGHEIGHAVMAAAEADPSTKPLVDAARVAAAKSLGAVFDPATGRIKYSSPQLDAIREHYMSLDPEGREISWEYALDENIAEHASVLFSGAPAGKLGGSRDTSAAVGNLLVRFADAMTGRQVGLAGTGVTTSDVLPYSPSFSLLDAVGEVIRARAMEESADIPDASYETVAPVAPAAPVAPVRPPAPRGTVDVGVATPVPRSLISPPAAPVRPAAPSGTVDVGVTTPIDRSLTTDRSMGSAVAQPTPASRPAGIDMEAPESSTPEAAGTTPAGAIRGTTTQAARTNFEAPLTGAEKFKAAQIQANPEARAALERAMSFVKALGGQKVGVPIAEITYKGTAPGDGVARSKRVAIYGMEGTQFKAFDIDRVNYNAQLLFDWANQSGRKLPYTSIDDPAFVQDLQTYVRNQAESRRGSGEPLMMGGEPSVASGGPVARLPREKEQFFSITMGETAKSVAEIATMRRDLAKRRQTAVDRQAATALASGVRGVETTEGLFETNALREELRRAGAPVDRIGEDPDPIRRQRNPNDRNNANMVLAARGILDFKLTGQSTSIPNPLAYEASFMPAGRPGPITENELAALRAGAGTTIGAGSFRERLSELPQKYGVEVRDASTLAEHKRRRALWASIAERLPPFRSGNAKTAEALNRINTIYEQFVREGGFGGPQTSFMPAATREDFSKANIKGILNKGGWAIFTAENPKSYKDKGVVASAEDNAARYGELKADLEAQGLEHIPVKGSYGMPENSFIVFDPSMTVDKAAELARKYDQDSIFTRHGLVYQDGRVNPMRGVSTFETKPDYYTEHDGHFFSGDIDFDTTIAADSVEGQTLRAEEALSLAVPKAGGAQFQPAGKVDSPEFKAWSRELPMLTAAEMRDGNAGLYKAYHGTRADFEAFSPDDAPERFSGGDPTTFLGSHFALEPSVASKFAAGLYGTAKFSREGGRVIPVVVRLENPLRTTEEELIARMLRGVYSADAVDYQLDSMGLEDAGSRYEEDAGFREKINRRAMREEAAYGGPFFDLAEEMATDLRSALKRAGHDGVIYDNVVEGGVSVIAFEPEQVKSAISPTFDPENPARFQPSSALAREKVKGPQVQFKSKPKEGAKGGLVDLVHFSSKTLKEIDPKKSFGKGAATPTDRQGMNKVFFYVKGTSYEGPIATRPNVYEAQVDGNSLYDYNEDALGVREIANREKRDQAIRDAGFVGYFVETPGFDAVAIFEPIKVKASLAEEVMSRRQLVDTGRAEETPADRRAFAAEDRRVAREEAAAQARRAKAEQRLRASKQFKDEEARLTAEEGLEPFQFEFGERMDAWVERRLAAEARPARAQRGTELSRRSTPEAKAARFVGLSTDTPRFQPTGELAGQTVRKARARDPLGLFPQVQRTLEAIPEKATRQQIEAAFRDGVKEKGQIKERPVRKEELEDVKLPDGTSLAQFLKDTPSAGLPEIKTFVRDASVKFDRVVLQGSSQRWEFDGETFETEREAERARERALEVAYEQEYESQMDYESARVSRSEDAVTSNDGDRELYTIQRVPEEERTAEEREAGEDVVRILDEGGDEVARVFADEAGRELRSLAEDYNNSLQVEVSDYYSENVPDIEEVGSEDGGVRYEKWTLRGEVESGSYKEVLFTVEGGAYPGYTSRHFKDQSDNYLAHARVDDGHTTSDGKSVYLVEEIQSDRHQAARDEGYSRRLSDAEIAEARVLRGTLKAAYEATLTEVSELEGRENVALRKLEEEWVAAGNPVTSSRSAFREAARTSDPDPTLDRLRSATNPETRAQAAAISDALVDARARMLQTHADYMAAQDAVSGQTSGVADAPFKKSWKEMVFKSLLAEAAQEGKDVFAWTPGDKQAARYTNALQKAVDTVEAKKNPDGSYDATFYKNTHVVTEEKAVTATRLSDVVGKAAATKIVQEADAANGEFAVVDNTELKVGGEGMRAVYDRVLVNYANDLLKKYGIKVGEVRLALPRADTPENVNPKVWGFPISEKLRQDIAAEGLPRYMPAGARRGDLSAARVRPRAAGRELASIRVTDEEPQE